MIFELKNFLRKENAMGYSNRFWQCPYYKWDERQAMPGEAGKIKFPDRQAALDYMDCYCSNEINWKFCSLACMLSGFYERMEVAKNVQEKQK